MRKFVIWLLLPLLTFSACVNEEEFPDTAQGNFEALWKIIDEHYCFFDYKQHEYGLDWNAIYNIYKVRAREEANKYQLFEVFTDMLSELRDGHVNLYSAFDNGRYWSWHEDYPTNFSDTLQRKYLDTDYRIASGMRYRILDDNIGYAYYGSFTSPVSDSGLNEILRYFAFCNGIIIDIRENGGGDLTNAEKFAARFCNEKTLVGYLQHKTGKGLRATIHRALIESQMAEEGGRANQPRGVQRSQRLRQVYEMFPTGKNRGRPDRRRCRHALYQLSAQRMDGSFLGLSLIRQGSPTGGIRHRA